MATSNIISISSKAKQYKNLRNLIKFQPEHKISQGVIKSNGFWRLASA